MENSDGMPLLFTAGIVVLLTIMLIMILLYLILILMAGGLIAWITGKWNPLLSRM